MSPASIPQTLPFSALLPIYPLLPPPPPPPSSSSPSPLSGERDVKRVLLLIRNEEDRERWLRQLSRITLSREDSSQKPPSPL